MRNEGGIDRIGRAVLAVVFLYLGIAVLAGIMKIIVFVLAAVMIVTSAVGVCPLYGVCKISTTSTTKK